MVKFKRGGCRLVGSVAGTVALVILGSAIGFADQPAATTLQPVPAISGPVFISRSSTLALKVANFTTAEQSAEQIAQQADAKLLDSKTVVDPKGRKNGWIRMQVPTSELDSLRLALRPIGVLYSDSVSADDQTSDYELDGRHATELENHQQQLDTVLNGTRRLRGSDILFIQDKLDRAATDEQDQLQDQVDIVRDAEMSTLLLELFEPNTLPPNPHSPPPPPAVRFQNSFGLAHSEFSQMIDRSATATAYAVQYAPIWAPILVIAISLLAVLWRMRMTIWSWVTLLIPNAVTRVLRGAAWIRDQWGDIRSHQTTQ